MHAPYTLFADAVGRVTQEHRVHRNVAIPSTVQVKMTYGDVVEDRLLRGAGLHHRR